MKPSRTSSATLTTPPIDAISSGSPTLPASPTTSMMPGPISVADKTPSMASICSAMTASVPPSTPGAATVSSGELDSTGIQPVSEEDVISVRVLPTETYRTPAGPATPLVSITTNAPGPAAAIAAISSMLVLTANVNDSRWIVTTSTVPSARVMIVPSISSDDECIARAGPSAEPSSETPASGTMASAGASAAFAVVTMKWESSSPHVRLSLTLTSGLWAVRFAAAGPAALRAGSSDVAHAATVTMSVDATTAAIR